MKLTEKHIREFFPRDKRFIHYVAKRYGYKFFSDDVVDKAHYRAALDITKIYNEGMEFESQEKMYGYVMNVIRFAILYSFTESRKEEFDKKLKRESDLYYDGNDDYNIYFNNAVDDGEEYDNTADFMLEELNRRVGERDFIMLQMRMNDMTYKSIAKELGVAPETVRKKIGNIKKKYEEIRNEIKKQDAKIKNEHIEKDRGLTVRSIQVKTQHRRNVEKQKERNSSSEAMLWLNSNIEV